MNKLAEAKRVRVLSLLCEGSSMRSISRVCDVSISAVSKLLGDAGKYCMEFHDEKVVNVMAKCIRIGDTWSFNAKQANVASEMADPVGAGDTWTWTGIEAESRLIVQWYVGRRDGETAKLFLDGLASRVANRVELTSDGRTVCLEAVEGASGCGVDYARLISLHGAALEQGKSRTSGAEHTAPIDEKPARKQIMTQFIERPKVPIANGFSKRLETHTCAVSLYFVLYNWMLIHPRLESTPAMAAGLTDKPMSMEDLCTLMESASPKPERPTTYKKRVRQRS